MHKHNKWQQGKICDYLQKIHSYTPGDQGVKIAVLDGDVDLTHPCFEGHNLEKSHTLSSLPSGHGTHIAGVLWGNQAKGALGVAPGCTGLIVPIFRTNEEGILQPTSQKELAGAIHRALDWDADIINISGGQLTDPKSSDPILQEAINRCVQNEKLIVAAAGNDACECVHVPAALPGVLAVGALEPGGLPRYFSNWGKDYRYKGILAPGYKIPGPVPGGQIAHRSGTSFATPIVSGVAALLMSGARLNGISISAQKAKSFLLSTAQACPEEVPDICQRFLAGALDIESAWNWTMMITQEISPPPSFAKTKTKYFMNLNEINPGEDTQIHDSPNENELYVEPQASASEEPESLAPLAKGAETNIENEELVIASECGCQNKGSSEPPVTEEVGGQKGQGFSGANIAFPLGNLNVGFLNQTQYELTQQLVERSGGKDRNFLVNLAQALKEHPHAVQNLVFVMTVNATPIFAISPKGPYSEDLLGNLIKILAAQFLMADKKPAPERVVKVALPGYINGQVKLTSGLTVPVLQPLISGINTWLYKDISPLKDTDHSVQNFLARMTYELRNRGTLPADRAVNFGSTHLFTVNKVFQTAHSEGFVWRDLQVKPAVFAKPGENTWDVTLRFFNPKDRNTATKNFSFSVDVSYVLPVIVGSIQEYYSF